MTWRLGNRKAGAWITAAILALFQTLTVLAGFTGITAAAEEEEKGIWIESSQGTVEILAEKGDASSASEEEIIQSGEVVLTGEESQAVVCMGEGRTVILDEQTMVLFMEEEQGHFLVKVLQGSLLLDVAEKLKEEESLSIWTDQTSVDIRGTIVFITTEPKEETAVPNAPEAQAEAAPAGAAQAEAALAEAAQAETSAGTLGYKEAVAARTAETTLGVLEGTAQITYTDVNGTSRRVDVSAGQRAFLEDSLVENGGLSPVVQPLMPDDLPGFIAEQIEASPELAERINNGSTETINEPEEPNKELHPAEGDWTYGGEVTIVAQSASKCYDGSPLTRPMDVLVYGLPVDFTIKVTVSGSQTDAGTSENHIDSYAIYNEAGENVSSHFTDIQTVSGLLLVDPSPLYVWTSSAEKTYDGEPLTSPEAQIRTAAGYKEGDYEFRNMALAIDALGGRKLFGLSGTVWVHAVNPLNGEAEDILLPAGTQLSVHIRNESTDSIYDLVQLTESEIPEEALRLYGANPELLSAACEDTGWDKAIVEKHIASLPETDGSSTERNGLQVSNDIEDRLLADASQICFSLDSSITNYAGRSLDQSEINFWPVSLHPDIRITATGSQTEVGESLNTYEIDWGGQNPVNYKLTEDLGTLTVVAGSQAPQPPVNPTPPPVNPTPQPVNPTPQPVNPTPQPVDPTPQPVDPEHNEYVTIQAAAAVQKYTGTPLQDGSVEVSGLPDGFTVTAVVEGSQTEVGVSENTVKSYQILDSAGRDVTSQFTNVVVVNGLLTVQPADVTISTGSASKPYDGIELSCPDVTVTGLVESEAGMVSVTAEGSITDVGTVENGYSVDWGDVNPANYAIAENLGTLEVTVNDNPITITSASATMPYRGGITLMSSEYEIDGLPEGIVCQAEMSGMQWTVGSSPNTISSYQFTKDDVDVTACFTNVTLVEGTLTVGKAVVKVWSDSVEKTYDGTPLYGGTIHWTGIYGMDNAQNGIRITSSASLTDAGSISDILSAEWNYPELEELYTIEITPGTLTVSPASLTISTGSASKVYDGEPLTCQTIDVQGLAAYDISTVTVTANGTITDVGTAVNTYTIDWGTANSANYTITSENLGTLEVTKPEELIQPENQG